MSSVETTARQNQSCQVKCLPPRCVFVCVCVVFLSLFTNVCSYSLYVIICFHTNLFRKHSVSLFFSSSTFNWFYEQHWPTHVYLHGWDGVYEGIQQLIDPGDVVPNGGINQSEATSFVDAGLVLSEHHGDAIRRKAISALASACSISVASHDVPNLFSRIFDLSATDGIKHHFSDRIVVGSPSAKPSHSLLCLLHQLDALLISTT